MRKASSHLIVFQVVVLAFAGAAIVPALEFGTLRLTTPPHAEISWEGIPVGSADADGRMTISQIPPGSYTLTVQASGFETSTQRLEIGPVERAVEIPLTAIASEAKMAPEPARTAVVEDVVPSPSPGLVDVPSDLAHATETAVEDDLPIEIERPTAGDVGEGLALARDRSPVRTTFFVALLAIIAVAAVWLGRRHSQAQHTPEQTEGPRIALATRERTRRRSPTFYEDLKRRETALEDFEETEPGGTGRRVIKLQVEENRPVEDDS